MSSAASAGVQGSPQEPTTLADDLLTFLTTSSSQSDFQTLEESLARISQIVCKTAGCLGAHILALDEENHPVTSGEWNLPFSATDSPMDQLYQLRNSLLEESTAEVDALCWKPLETRLFKTAANLEVQALALKHSRRTMGVLAFAAAKGEASVHGLEVERNARLLSAVVGAVVQREALNKTTAVLRLAREYLETYEPKEAPETLPSLLAKVQTLFRASAVTLLLVEGEVLRLAASTDPGLGLRGAPVVYPKGVGLTGWIFQQNQPLRINNTRNKDEVRRLTGLNRERGTFRERDAEGDVSGIFLGVPLRSGGKVVGVIRMTRRGGTSRFTRGDEEALQALADLLGTVLRGALRVFLSDGILESVTEGIAVSHQDFLDKETAPARIILANKGVERLLGIPSQKLVGSMARNAYADSEEASRVRSGLEKSIQRAKVHGRDEYGPVPARLKHENGSQVPVMISYRILANRLVQPPSFYIIGLARDPLESEHLFELLDAMDIAYFKADKAGRTIQTTPADCRLTGYTQEKMQKLDRDELYPERGTRERLLEKARNNGGRLTGELLRLKRKDGTLFWAQGDIRILKDRESKETGLEGFYRDVSERVKLQGLLERKGDPEELLSEYELFERLKEEVEFHHDYMSSIGHQIQTPLGSLVGTLENFQKGLIDNAELDRRLPWIIGQARACSRLVRNLTFMDQILRGETIERRHVSLARLAIETCLDFEQQLKAKHLKLTIDRKSLERYLEVHGHVELLRQVLVNLVDNAIKYSAPYSSIYIRGHFWPNGRMLEVKSRGFRIRGQDQERVFERGYRSRQAQAVISQGTGLGLWLVKKIIEAHGAEITCCEEPGHGHPWVVFRIRFPHSAASPGHRRAS